ncbi:MAG: CYTH domain-containing protein [Gammaproteobacteria bacterium]|nr:CYTH domain-containing protein [Gammaproteobacteria bacterium]
MLEQEIKLSASDPEILHSAIGSALIRSYMTKRAEPARYVSRYHDTKKRVFQQLRCSLRSRIEGDVMRATFKEKGSIVDGLSRHSELEADIDDWLRSPGMLPPGVLRDRVLQLVDENEPLETIVAVEMTRTILELAVNETKMECAVDIGQVSANGRSVPLYELELELKRGKLATMREIAEKLKAHYDLRWSEETKLAVGMRLWNE